MTHPKIRAEGARFLGGRLIPPWAVGYVVAGVLSAPNLVYWTLGFAFHTLWDSNFAECSLALGPLRGYLRASFCLIPTGQARGPYLPGGPRSLCRCQGGATGGWVQGVSGPSCPVPPCWPPSNEFPFNVRESMHGATSINIIIFAKVTRQVL